MPESDPWESPAFFAAPSLEGARLALRSLLEDAVVDLSATPHCAVAIDVSNADGVLVQRALSHADVDDAIRDALRTLVDQHVVRFADAQLLDRHERGSPYRSGDGATNDVAGFPCGHAAAVARGRIAKLRARLRSVDEMDVRLYAVPFLVVRIRRRYAHELAVIMRREDGAYVHVIAATSPNG